MKFVHLILGGAMVLTAGAAASARERLSPEDRIAKLTAGRVIGKPVDCIQPHNIRSSEIIDRTAIVYTMNNGLVYVNRPDDPTVLDDNDIMINRIYGSQLCSIDIVRLVDRSSQFSTGSLALGEFVPYAKERRKASN